jgi:hypothetical protein
MFWDRGAVDLVHLVAVDVPRHGRSAPVERDLACPKPGEVVVEVFVRRFHDLDQRLAWAATCEGKMLVHREHAGRVATDGEHAPDLFEIREVEHGDSSAGVRRLPADVLDREVAGERDNATCRPTTDHDDISH